MKKTFLAAFCFLTVSSFAQIKIGVEAGYNSSKLGMTGANQQYYSLSSISTFDLGMIAEKSYSKQFSISSGLLFFQKGGIKNKTDFAISGSNTTTKINYLHVPLNLNYKIALDKNIKAIITAGLYGAYGISGSEKGTYESSTSSTPINNDIHFTNNSSYYSTTNTAVKPFDFGYHFAAGIEWKSYQLKLNYNHGFSDINPSGSTKFYNENLGISLAYLLSK